MIIAQKMTALCSIYYLHLFTFLLFFTTLFLTLYFLFLNFTSNSLLNLLFSFLYSLFSSLFRFLLSFKSLSATRDAHTQTIRTQCAVIFPIIYRSLSPPQFLPLFAKTIAYFALFWFSSSVTHARTLIRSSPQTTHNQRLLRLLKLSRLLFSLTTTSCQITRAIGTGSAKPLRGWRRSLCSLRRDATFLYVCMSEKHANLSLARSR